MLGDLQFQFKQDWVNLLKVCLVSVILMSVIPFFEHKPQEISAVHEQAFIFVEEKDAVVSIVSVSGENTFLAKSEPQFKEQVPTKKIEVIVTAYSSTSWQTDDTPFITAAGTNVRSGVVAANFLPFGTHIKIPEIYGDEIFVVEDRMHPRNNYRVDIWFPSYYQALNFGAKRTYVEILEG